MTATRAGGRIDAARKYDLLTLLGVIGLSGGPTLQRSMLRLTTLVTARYNWASGELSVGRREIARLWAVDERTVKREMARLKEHGFLVLRRPGVRGRVSSYAIDFDAVRAACDWSRVGPDFAERMAADAPAAKPASARDGEGADVIRFPGAADPAIREEAEALSEWSRARRMLRSIGEAAHARWIAPLVRARRENGRLTLEAPSTFHASFVERSYLEAIRAALREADPDLRDVRVVARSGR